MIGRVYLSKILIYPIKGLDPVEVEEAKLTHTGSLEHDRELALFDEEGNPVSGKKEKKIHEIRSRVDLSTGVVSLLYRGRTHEFTLEETRAMEDFFSEIFGYRVHLRKDEGGFPDDRRAHGPTLVSGATLREVASWFGLEEENARRRFRTNLEIEGVPPFWEDQLLGKRFAVGEVVMEGKGISKRCPVPTRDPFSGKVTKNFVKTFVEKRKETMPDWSPKEAFSDTFYRLCLNTTILEGGTVRVGDELTLIG